MYYSTKIIQLNKENKAGFEYFRTILQQKNGVHAWFIPKTKNFWFLHFAAVSNQIYSGLSPGLGSSYQTAAAPSGWTVLPVSTVFKS